MPFLRTAAIAAAAILATHLHAADQAIKVGTNRALGTVTPYIARTGGAFAQAKATVDIVDFTDGSTLMEAFASGQLDIALLGIAPTAIWHGKGAPLKVVASANGGGHVLLTRADTGIAGVADLKGRIVATPKPGTVTDTLFRSRILPGAGLDPAKDLKIVPNVAPADQATALFVTRSVDAALTWEPFASQAQAKFPDARVLYDAAAELRASDPAATAFYPVNVVIARQSFIDSRPDALRAFLAGYRDTVEFINGKPDEANALIAAELKLDVAVVVAARKRIDYTWKVDVAGLTRTLEWSTKLGYVKAIPDDAKLYDLSFLPH